MNKLSKNNEIQTQLQQETVQKINCRSCAAAAGPFFL